MFKLHLDSKDKVTQNIYSACSSSKVKMLSELASDRAVIYITNHDSDCHKIKEQALFFNKDVNVEVFSAWDCLPYDRVSPSIEITSSRVSCLNKIIKNQNNGILIITSIKAISRLIPSKENLFSQKIKTYKIGDIVNLEKLRQELDKNSFFESNTVRECGQLSIKNNIIDIYLSNVEPPVRIMLQGEKIISIKSFDPEKQTSIKNIESFSILPINELNLSDKNIENFNNQYKSTFSNSFNDPILKAINEKRRIAGMEHWLPFLYNQMSSIFDYCENYVFALEADYTLALNSRQTEIQDLYQSRLDMLEISSENKYRPIPMREAFITEEAFEKQLKNKSTYIFHDNKSEKDKSFDAGFSFIDAFTNTKNSFEDIKDRVNNIKNKKTIIACYSEGSRDRINSILREHDISNIKRIDNISEARKISVSLAITPINKGFENNDFYIITEQDILGERISRKAKREVKADNFISEISNLNVGDLVVHAEHGIGRFEGLEVIESMGIKHDFLKIVYKGEDKLFVPVENLDMLSMFGEEHCNLDKLGSSSWQARKAKVKKNLFAIAEGLMKIAAKRQLKKVEKLEINQGEYQEFCSKFPYNETEDQIKVINEVLDDMQSGKAMDRLVCGDVGFGKTEIAIRAAFAMAKSGKQVAIIVPTTLLCMQHYKNFKNRFMHFGIKVEQLSRLVTPAHAKKVKAGLTDGTIDLIIGTHALLSDSVKFKNLGLLIVDEEQRFGVKQKEKIKSIKDDVHVLTLTATPIPRTLQLSLTGVRDLSLITTPPVDKLAIRTSILPYDSVIIKEALLKEHYRGGQSFYVCPRIKDIPKIQKRLDAIVPELSYITATGQLSGKDLDEKMSAFYNGEADILLATNIIETGIDIPSANTIIFHRSDILGLSQLYQLRGRVGRGKYRGYSYFTYSEDKVLSDKAKKRLEVIETLDSLGAGFQLSSYDLDIRGAGNLLGEQQSGHIKEVGLEMYQNMLREAVEQVKAGGSIEDISLDNHSVNINIGISVLISPEYVPDMSLRMSLYKRASKLENLKEINDFHIEMIDRFGEMPEEFKNLLETVEIKILAKEAGVAKIEAGNSGGSITLYEEKIKDFDKLINTVMTNPLLKIHPDNQISIIGAGWSDSCRKIQSIKKLLKQLK